uniref:cGMP-dependent protein kinase n=2 Tax=Paramecium tetraurelia TaxID=5888 RepID=Q3SEL5_PARTE|nr:cGMP-dependent protein kinase 13-3 [Paramecium tetraurelia]
MGNACHCQQFTTENMELMSGRSEIVNKKGDTITIPHQNGTTVTKKTTHKQNDDDGDEDQQVQEVQQIELKRGDKKKQAKINAVSDTVEIFENIKKLDKRKSPFDYQLMLNAFNEHFIFKSVPQSDIEYVVDQMFYCTVPDGQFVFKQGDKASSYFLIERGQCQIIINGELKKTLKSGDAFGELAMLYNAPRSASVRAVGDCAFWAIDRNTFRKVVEQQNQRSYEENREFMKKVEFFSFLTEEQRDAISSVLITSVFKKGEIIVSEGDVANSFYIIKKGKVAIIKGEKEVSQMNSGESFGEAALYQSCQRAATVKAAEEEVRCLSLSKDDIQRILGQKIQTVKYINTQKWALQQSPLLGKLTSIQIEKILQNIRQVHYEKNEVIIKAGQPCTKVYIILEGEIATMPSKQQVLGKGKIFGEQFLKSQNQDSKLPETIQVQTDESIIAEFEIKMFFDMIGGSVEQMIQKNENSHEQKYLNRVSVQQQKKDYSNLKLDNLICIKKLGQGQFGNVYLVRTAQDEKLYALKCISKAQIVEQHLERHLAQEKQVLSTINFPFLMQFYKSMKDQNYIYFLVEFIKGMELFDAIREIGLLTTVDSQFYIGSLLICVEYLHKLQIIYRDIKPENIMVDEKGYLRMIDMGTAKFLNQKSIRTYTIIGTPHYMAPEIITGKGYTFTVDLWSIGVCLFEFMCGGVPYAEDADDPYEIYEEIQKKSITFPPFMKDKKAKKFIEQLLLKTPEARLGGGYASLKANSWFDKFDWDKLMDKELKAPFVPKKSRMIQEKDIQTALSNGKLASKEINQIGAPYKKEKARDPNWDSNY